MVYVDFDFHLLSTKINILCFKPSLMQGFDFAISLYRHITSKTPLNCLLFLFFFFNKSLKDYQKAKKLLNSRNFKENKNPHDIKQKLLYIYMFIHCLYSPTPQII